VPASRPDGLSEEHTRELISHTYAMIDLIDRSIGRILEALDAEGLTDDTVVVFTSDHGELLGDHGLWFKGPFYYEGLVNTPLIISCPPLLAPGTSDALISTIDLAPTLCDLAELPAMPFINGVSQMPVLLGRGTGVRDRCLVEYRNGYRERDCSSKALIARDLKYVRYQIGEEELTDLARDPLETTNVADHPDYRQVKEELRVAMLDEVLSTEPRGPEQLVHY
jgi:arylsulfatase A-like enzyme